MENFERLLGTDGLSVVVYLPTREGQSKSKNAILKCDRGSTLITCEIRSSGQKKKLKFEVSDIISLTKGKGSSLPLANNIDTHRLFCFVIQDKPELNVEMESKEARDIAMRGFNYVIARRRSGTGVVVKGAKFGNDVVKTAGGGIKILWVTWVDKEKPSMFGSMAPSKWNPRVLMLTSEHKLLLFAPHNDSKKDQPADMEHELRKYFEGRWNNDVLLKRMPAYTLDATTELKDVKSVVPAAKDKRVVELHFNDDSQNLSFRFDDEQKRNDALHFLDDKAKRLRRGG